MDNVYNRDTLIKKAKELFKEERSINRLKGWFLARETANNYASEFSALPLEQNAAETLVKIAEAIPLSISRNAIFAGTQRDAFARSYALINPSFRVENFSGYCDPTAVYNDIEPDGDITAERIETLREATKKTAYVRELSKVYAAAERETSEVIFFVEQVTGHLIPDFRPVLQSGTHALTKNIDDRLATEKNAEKRANLSAMKASLRAAEIFSARYLSLAKEQLKTADSERKAELQLMVNTLSKVPGKGASTLYEAIQSFMLLWQAMCLEQAPNPFAFSVGNADRIFEPYRKKENLPRDTAAALLAHFLVFFNVGDRSWAISQNLIVGGRDNDGRDMTNETSYALLDAYCTMNLPQPILSVKLHKNTPEKLYRELGRFWFTPGTLTPSLFNDDVMFEVLRKNGVDKEDLPDYCIAGCQEPLIMGKDNANTTNSWLNLPKILEITLTGGISLLSGANLSDCGLRTITETLKNIRALFYENAAIQIKKMVDAANSASKALSYLRVPFLSSFMGGIESGYDLRDTEHQGTKYNGSGCLVHGLSVIADSFIAIDKLLAEKSDKINELLPALKSNWNGYEDLRAFLKSAPKYGNNADIVDREAADIAQKISDIVSSQKNYLGNPFRPDFSTPTTHLLYGYWVGASCDGRGARDMLGYGIDPLYGEAQNGLGYRLLSNFKLPFLNFTGGYASHLGIDPKNFVSADIADKGAEFRDKIINTLFFNPHNKNLAPYYIYFNITTADTLRKVLADPKQYAPDGIYIMRIHGTFVNFLDLSPHIQQDIITRLDPASTTVSA